jgi:hypothetical protein
MTPLKRRRHELFAQGLAGGASQADAYETAGFRRDDGHASRLAGDGRIQTRVTELQTESAQRVALDREGMLRMLISDRDLARARGQAAAAIRATELLGREICGMFIERKEIKATGDLSGLSDAELKNQLREQIATALKHPETRRLILELADGCDGRE